MISSVLGSALRRRLSAIADEVRLDSHGKLTWVERADGRLVRHDTEPGTTARERFLL